MERLVENHIATSKTEKLMLIRTGLLLILCWFVMMAVCRNQIETMTLSGSDGMTYFNAARNLRRYHMLTLDRDGSMFEGVTAVAPTDTLAPGYPVFLRLLFAVFPENLTTVFASNLVLGVMTILLLWGTMEMLGVSPWLSLAVLFLYVNYPTTVDMTTTCLTENLSTPLLFGSMVLCVRAFRERRLRLAAGAFFLLGLATTVRGQMFLFAPLELGLLLSDRGIRLRGIQLVGMMVGLFLIIYGPMWIWLARQMGRFVLYPTAGDGPKIWGAMPYFIDMTWSNGRSLAQVQEYNSRVAQGEYLRWRSFGMLWRMWFDCWSEDLPHSWYMTHWALWLHPLIVVPTLLLLPAFGRRYRREEWALATVPVLLTVTCLFYHGLPRYVSASYPVLFALAGKNAQILADRAGMFWARKRGTNRVQAGRIKEKAGWKPLLAMGISGLFSLAVVYSLCVFPWQVDAEQSAYRLIKYEGVRLEEIQDQTPILSRTIPPEEIAVWNALPEGDGKYIISWTDHAIIQLTDLAPAAESEEDRIITHVVLDVDGGNLYDFSTVYWLTEDIQAWNEDHVYSIPRSSVSLMEADKPEVWIDGDAEDLLIVPSLFRGNEITVHQITIEKYRVE